MSAALCLLLAVPALGLSSPQELVRGTVAARADYAPVPWFPEKLEFEIKWGVFSVGKADMSVQEVVDFAGQHAYHVVSRANSNGFADRFYKVRDVNESWIHVGDLRSLGYSKVLREGSFSRDEWVVYDYDRRSFAAARVGKDGAVSRSTGTIPGPVQDILSSLYSIRPKPLKVGDVVTLDVNTRSNWPLAVRVVRKATIEVPAGRFKTVLVEPELRDEGIFVQKGKKLKVWLTDDERHIPVFMSVEVLFGAVSAYLLRIERPKGARPI